MFLPPLPMITLQSESANHWVSQRLKRKLAVAVTATACRDEVRDPTVLRVVVRAEGDGAVIDSARQKELLERSLGALGRREVLGKIVDELFFDRRNLVSRIIDPV